MTHTVLTISERAECSESTKLITCRYYEQNWWGSSVVGKDEAFFFFLHLKHFELIYVGNTSVLQGTKKSHKCEQKKYPLQMEDTNQTQSEEVVGTRPAKHKET